MCLTPMVWGHTFHMDSLDSIINASFTCYWSPDVGHDALCVYETFKLPCVFITLLQAKGDYFGVHVFL